MSQPPDVDALCLVNEYDGIPYEEDDIDYDLDISNQDPQSYAHHDQRP